MLVSLELILYIIGLVIGIYILVKILNKIFKNKKLLPKLSLSAQVRAKADRKFTKLLNRFKKKHRRNPTKDELFRLIINASHITIRRRGKKGHWGRQKVRKLLLEKHKIPYKMR